MAHQRHNSQRRKITKYTNGEDNISEIDMNSDTRSMHSASVGGGVSQSIMQNNLMGSSGNDFYAKNKNIPIMGQSARSG